MTRPCTLAVGMLLIVGSLALAIAPRASAPAAAPAISDLAWMEGKWVREQAGSYLEETWSSPVSDSLFGMFRWNRDGKPWMCELMTITLDGETPVFRLRHFDPALKPWEKESPLTYPLKSMGEREVVFEDPASAPDHPRRFIYRRAGDSLTVRLENADGTGDAFEFALADRAGDADAAKPQAAADSPLGFTGGLVLRFTVTDRTKSRDWYRDVLGFHVLFEVDEIGWTEMSNDEAKLTIGLSQSDVASPSQGTMPVMGVKNLDATRTHLESRGVKFTGPTETIPDLVKLATLLDPDGYRIMLYQALQD